MSEKLVWDQVQTYAEGLVPSRSTELAAMEAHAKQERFPIIGPACGQFCYLAARMIGARNVFELGSGFGYSTAWFARAVRENGGGTVHHVVWDQALSRRAKEHLAKLGVDDQVQFHIGEAVHTLKEQPGPFDLIFNDIDKQGYPDSLPVIASKLRKGGLLIIDNMLWHGQVFDPTDDSPDNGGVREFTRRITSDPQWIVSLVPLRDGMIVAMRG
ncbi:MAG: O-methyltransferase [Deltaproteobacteria bacterium]|nr:O-methyltransferase [Deltaproteobacteria bacterium]